MMNGAGFDTNFIEVEQKKMDKSFMTGLEGLCLTIHSNRAKYTSIAES